MFQNKITLTLT